MKYARIVNGTVETVSLQKESGAEWIEVADDVFPGFRYNNGRFTPLLIPVKTDAEKVAMALSPTESPRKLARKLEDLIMTLDANGIAVPADAKTWAEDRDTRRTDATR